MAKFEFLDHLQEVYLSVEPGNPFFTGMLIEYRFQDDTIYSVREIDNGSTEGRYALFDQDENIVADHFFQDYELEGESIILENLGDGTGN